MNWKNYPNFSLSELNKDNLEGGYMTLHFMDSLQSVRSRVKSPFIIHEGFAKDGHAPKSNHYTGEAADLHVEGLNLLEMALSFYKYSNFSIGLYPEWNNQGVHVDDRLTPIFWIKLGSKYAYYTTFSSMIKDYILT